MQHSLECCVGRLLAQSLELCPQSPHNQNAVSELTAGLCLSQHWLLGMETYYTDWDASLIL